ncbi:hypothetical protein CAEBREN_24133 [Caenorhabditis brenneri]|uniref:Uncharacterized protein n=1 Tax=Caenorhabditis brenneri TaxID=135651 RepID=G0N993_CAEBE|nr:hypothetical protein CAEBREN_24133 [Caenorhabditis brenneri]
MNMSFQKVFSNEQGHFLVFYSIPNLVYFCHWCSKQNKLIREKIQVLPKSCFDPD